ncbi:MAG: hypothetical protein E6Q91_01790 [Actinobacteria bacterium]|nr:MAG: hypothetical protein E6Q91_01790 [Actinomycetota bacterium]
MSGFVKGTLLGQALPFDLTVVSLGVLAFSAMIAVFRSRRTPPLGNIAPLLVFIGVVLLAALRIDPSPYGMEKLIQFSLITGVAVVSIAAIVATPAQLSSTNKAWLVLGLTACGLSLPFVRIGGLTRAGFDDLSSNAGTLGYAAALAGVWVIVSAAEKRLPWPVALPLLAVFSYFTIASASRGALLGAVAALLAYGLIAARPGLLAKVLLPVLIGIWIALQLVPLEVRERVKLEDVTRLQAWFLAREGFLAEPILGNGLGSYATVDPYLLYPHNLVLETAYELGLVGLVSLAFVLFFSFRNLVRFRAHAETRVLGAVTAFWLASSMVSLDLRNRLLWIPIALCLCLPAIYAPSRRPPRPESASEGHPSNYPLRAIQGRSASTGLGR